MSEQNQGQCESKFLFIEGIANVYDIEDDQDDHEDDEVEQA